MATDQVGESQDALEMIATGEPLSAVLDALCRAIDMRSGLCSWSTPTKRT